MSTITVTTRIHAHVDVVFGNMSDIEHGTSQVSSIHHIDLLTPGPMRVGTRWIETRVVLGRADSAQMEITAYERNRMFTISHDRAGVRVDTTFWFAPADGGTTVTVEFELESSWLPLSLLRPLGWAIQHKVERLLAHDLADSKYAVEHRTPSTPTS
jgi:hypothetical protein